MLKRPALNADDTARPAKSNGVGDCPQRAERAFEKSPIGGSERAEGLAEVAITERFEVGNHDDERTHEQRCNNS
jgi:hypothetical protein